MCGDPAARTERGRRRLQSQRHGSWRCGVEGRGEWNGGRHLTVAALERGTAA